MLSILVNTLFPSCVILAFHKIFFVRLARDSWLGSTTLQNGRDFISLHLWMMYDRIFYSAKIVP